MKSPLLWDDDHAEQAYAKALSRCQFASDTKMHNGVSTLSLHFPQIQLTT